MLVIVTAVFLVLSQCYGAFDIQFQKQLDYAKCGTKKWTIIDSETLLLDPLLKIKVNPNLLKASPYGCASTLPTVFSRGDTIEITVYFEVNNNNSELVIELINELDDSTLQRFVYNRQHKDFVQGWHVISLSIDKETTGYVTFLGFSEDEDIVIVNSIQFKDYNKVSQWLMLNENKDNNEYIFLNQNNDQGEEAGDENAESSSEDDSGAVEENGSGDDSNTGDGNAESESEDQSSAVEENGSGDESDTGDQNTESSAEDNSGAVEENGSGDESDPGDENAESGSEDESGAVEENGSGDESDSKDDSDAVEENESEGDESDPGNENEESGDEDESGTVAENESEGDEPDPGDENEESGDEDESGAVDENEGEENESDPTTEETDSSNDDSQEEYEMTPDNSGTFWNPLTIGIVTVSAAAVLLLVTIGAYQFGKIRSRNRVDPLIDIEDIEAPRVIPRVRSVYNTPSRVTSDLRQQSLYQDSRG